VNNDESRAVTTEVMGDGKIFLVTLYRPRYKNAVDGATAQKLYEAFQRFERDDALLVAVLFGDGGTFCAGADLTRLSNPLQPAGDLGPMGPTRLTLSKPVIAAVEGFAVAGGLELALWCDLRVAATDSVFGVFCRRFGVPLIDGGTFRLAQSVGTSRAMDAVLTGRPIHAEEAHSWGLVNRLVPRGRTKEEALALALQISGHPQTCMRSDRLSLLHSVGQSIDASLRSEFHFNKFVVSQPTFQDGAKGGFQKHQKSRDAGKSKL
jgi:enoyl-CoA hydratase